MKQKNTQIFVLFLIISSLFFMGCTKKTETVFQTESNTESNTESSSESNTETVTAVDEALESSSSDLQKETGIYVHVCGAVMTPGVYEIPEGSRVCEAVKAAGGFAKTAAKDFLNQAILVQDGQKIVILSEEEVRLLSQNQIQEYLAESAGLGKDATEIAQNTLSSNTYPIEITGQDIVADSSTAVIKDETGSNDLININTASANELTSITGIGASRAEAIIAYREENGVFTCIEDIMKVTGIKEGLFQKLKDQIKVN